MPGNPINYVHTCEVMWYNSLVVARQNVQITSILSDFTLGSWTNFDVSLSLIWMTFGRLYPTDHTVRLANPFWIDDKDRTILLPLMKNNLMLSTHTTLIVLFQSIHRGDGWRVHCLGSCGHADPGRSGVYLHPGGDQLSCSTSSLCVYVGSIVARMQWTGMLSVQYY